MPTTPHVQVAVRHGDARGMTDESVTEVGWRTR